MGEASGGAGRTSQAIKKTAWSKARKDTFLDHLAATCNVSAAAGVVGVMPAAVYQLRRRNPAFRADWADALAQGYEMLETQLVGHALAGGARTITNGDVSATGTIDVGVALKLLSRHRGAMLGKPFRGGVAPKTATVAETNAALLKRLLVVETREAADGQTGRVPALPAPR